VTSTSAGARTPSTSGNYVRFIILSGPRTGSNMLAEALNSSPSVRCFHEVLNFVQDFIMYDVYNADRAEGSAEDDMAFRERDPIGFLEQRIFGEYPDGIRAVGFKYHYGQIWGLPGVFDHIVKDESIRVVHLKRRNRLRTLLSLKAARETGRWMEVPMTPARALGALRHPSRLVRKVAELARRPDAPTTVPEHGLTISHQELDEFIISAEMTESHFEEVFAQHPSMTVYYEDILHERDVVYESTQSFLDVEAYSLSVTLTKQHPEPARQLLSNFEELHSAFKGTKYAAWFEEEG